MVSVIVGGRAKSNCRFRQNLLHELTLTPSPQSRLKFALKSPPSSPPNYAWGSVNSVEVPWIPVPCVDASVSTMLKIDKNNLAPSFPDMYTLPRPGRRQPCGLIRTSSSFLIFDFLFFISLCVSLFWCRAELNFTRNEVNRCPTTAGLSQTLLPLSLHRKLFISSYTSLIANLTCSRIESALKTVSMKSIEYQRQLKELEVLHLTPILLHVLIYPDSV